jgi:hypothetical protein
MLASAIVIIMETHRHCSSVASIIAQQPNMQLSTCPLACHHCEQQAPPLSLDAFERHGKYRPEETIHHHCWSEQRSTASDPVTNAHTCKHAGHQSAAQCKSASRVHRELTCLAACEVPELRDAL